METKVTPIINGDIPKAVASSAECFTAYLPEKITRTIPPMRMKIAKIISIIKLFPLYKFLIMKLLPNLNLSDILNRLTKLTQFFY